MPHNIEKMDLSQCPIIQKHWLYNQYDGWAEAAQRDGEPLSEEIKKVRNEQIAPRKDPASYKEVVNAMHAFNTTS
ncbi:MAG: hypothetical protein US63_C0030G0005 [Candidatus Moranbacteria bacterium GW2011_GWC2_37_8]|nr:MAG: hypothetical protein US63_C0030G0005 [Candidatus Moranbacteria bacterium GW2011_GWC2_37_8]KKQ61233.1 MAG: hypothetical protein US82_C0024G0007 [Parcubacteria group bacterium GW2011_GWC1_38_22]